MNPERREFLKNSAKYGIILGGAGALISSPAWLKWFLGESVKDAHAGEKLQNLEWMGGSAQPQVDLDRVRLPLVAFVPDHHEIHREAP